jgi:hypothetical protein
VNFQRVSLRLLAAGDGDSGKTDPEWQPLSVTPNFPEHPSGHACASAAVAYTIEGFFPGITIPARSALTGEERTYRSARAVVDEVIAARTLIGVHFRAASEDGAEIGREVAAQIIRSTAAAGSRRRSG